MKIRLGMVGGGTGAFIGEVHRIAARLDNRYELVAGAFSSDWKGLGSRRQHWALRQNGPMTISQKWPRKKAREKTASMLSP